MQSKGFTTGESCPEVLGKTVYSWIPSDFDEKLLWPHLQVPGECKCQEFISRSNAALGLVLLLSSQIKAEDNVKKVRTLWKKSKALSPPGTHPGPWISRNAGKLQRV